MCQHENNQVTNSRTPASTYSNGKPHYREAPYPVITYRTRKCNDCGDRFHTVEILREFVDQRIDGNHIKKELSVHIEKFLQQQQPRESDNG